MTSTSKVTKKQMRKRKQLQRERHRHQTTSPPFLRKPLKQSKSTLRQGHKGKLKSWWKEEWQASTRAERLKHVDPTLPSLDFIKLTSDPKLSRQGASWLFQLRVGHFPLNSYLHRFKRTESTQCPACGHQSETPQHFLLDCPAYAHERWSLLK